MTPKDSKTSQFCKAGEILSKLKPLITSEDRKAAMKELQLSDNTIVAYLKGKVADLATAEKLIVFFSEKIDAREILFDQKLAGVTGE